MEIGSVARQPTATPVRTSNPAAVAATQRVDVATPTKPAATELDADRAVTRVAESDAVRLEVSTQAQERVALDEAMRRLLDRRSDLDMDEETGTPVYRTIDGETGEVVNQVPSEELLKLRAYLRSDLER